VTSLRPLPPGKLVLDAAAFRDHYREAGRRCWLVKTDRPLSAGLNAYFASVPEQLRETSTCREREAKGRPWWEFRMPLAPPALASMSFKGPFPKAARNDVGACAVGSVCSVYGVTAEQADLLAGGFGGLDIRGQIVPHSNGLRKIEISQLNGLLDGLLSGASG